jgi:tRNA threonylcarbamoyladenosine biosynthesis protein TsaB
MLALALTSSTARASIGLYTPDETLSERSNSDPKKHSEFLNPALEAIMQESGKSFAQIDVIAVDGGPGSFTGLRVGINLARALSYSLQKPVLQVSSLSILLAEAGGEHQLALINAYKNMVFYSVQKHGAETEPAVVNAIDLESALKQDLPLNCCGEGYQVYQAIWSPALFWNSQNIQYPSSKILAKIAFSRKNFWTKDWKSLIPLYIRASAAEENQVRK